MTLKDTLTAEIEARRDDLIALCQDLIRIPTLNPPGENYREICDYLDRRLLKSGFHTELLRAEGAKGDSAKYPRWNIVARREGTRPGECVHFNSHIDVVEVGRGWTTDPFGGEVKDKDAVTYKPVIALFAMAALMALAASWAAFGNLATVQAAEWFIAIAMCLLALQKLKDVEGFATMFLNYDLLAQRWVRYAYIYPFAEALAGVLMMAGALMWVSIPVALFIGGIGAVSVFKAVYIDKRELKCACVGGDSNVPLGFVSLTENLMMISMAVWMIFKPMGIGH